MNIFGQAGSEVVSVELTDGPILELGELQLSLIGGGTGDISLG